MLRADSRISCPWLLLMLLTLTPGAAVSQASDTAAVVRTVFAFEDARFGAMVRADTAWLRSALADNLSYVHSSGRREGKAEYVASIGVGTMRYEEFTPRERDVRLVGTGAAVVVGRAHARAVANNQPVDVEVRYTAVYERRGESWRLMAWQTTRIP